MVRMDNLSAVILTSRVFPRGLTAFIGFIQRHLHPLPGGGGMERIPMAESIRIGWRLESESGGGMERNRVAACAGIRN